MSDKVIRPSHYGGPDASCDPLSVMEGMDAFGYANLAEAFAHANVLKLAWRVGKKAGEEESDREKLAFYALTLAFGRDAAEEGIRAARESMPEVTPQDLAGVFRRGFEAFHRATERVSQALREVAAPPTPVPATAEPPPPVPVPTTDDLVAAGLLTSAQIAEQLGITKEALGWHVQHGAICPVRIGKGGRPSLFEPAEVARFVAAREQARRPDGVTIAPSPKAVTEAPAVPVPSPPPSSPPPVPVPVALTPRLEPEAPSVPAAAETLALRQRERRESVRLDRAIDSGRTQFHPAFVLCSREGDDGREYRAFSSARAADTENVGWIVVCRYQKNGLGRWEEIGDGTGAPAPVGSNLARRVG